MSTANYIIICNGRTRILAEKDPLQRLLIASDTASRVVDNLSIRFPLSGEDVKPISDLLHRIMGSLAAEAPDEVIAIAYENGDTYPIVPPMKKEQMDGAARLLIDECSKLMAKFEGTDEYQHGRSDSIGAG